jgi:ribosomal protein L40E
MYCTKCGARLPTNTDTCLRCGAHFHASRPARQAARGKLALFSSLVAIFVIAAIVVFERGPRQSSAAGANLLEAVQSVRPHAWHQAATGPAGLFLLPNVDTGFVGSWGGYAKLQPGQNAASATVQQIPMSYYLGEQNGVVFLKTSVYGDPKWPVVKSAVRVLSPKSVEIKLDSECESCTPPVKQQEITRLALINKEKLEAECDSYAYFKGDGHVDLSYKGTLSLLTPDQLAAIDHAVEHDGKLLTTINSKQPVP